FIIFPWANDILFEDGNLLDLSPSIINERVWPAYEKFIQDLVNDQVNYWTQLGLTPENIFDKSYRNKQGDNLVDLAANYAINNFIFLHNQTQLFSGDPALHGKPVKQEFEKGLDVL